MRRSFLMTAAAMCLGVVATAAAAQTPILFPPEQFDSVDLVPRQSSDSGTGLIETLGSLVDRFEPVNGLSDKNKYRRLGKAVGRLKMLVTMPSGERGVRTCTATLIARDRLITNHHCVPGPQGETVERVMVDFFYLDQGSNTVRQFEVELAPLEADKALDFSILKVRGDPEAEAGIAPAPLKARPVLNNESLFIIHHPGGQPQRLTRAFCRAHTTTALEGTEIRHLCDTMSGSSGALVFADDDFAFVGIHHRGGLAPGDLSSFNRGTNAGSLGRQSPALAALSSAPDSAGIQGERSEAPASPSGPTCNVRGPWDIFQSNGPVVRVVLSQDNQDGALTGIAHSENGAVPGAAKGVMRGRSFSLAVKWENGATGQYIGVVGQGERISGTAFNPANPLETATWNAGEKSFFGCP